MKKSLVTSHADSMACRRKKDLDESEEGGDTPIRNVIGKEDHKVTSHQLLMAVRRKHKH